MNREIKFRAWSIKNRRMFRIARFDFSDYTIYSHLFACDGFLGEDCEIMQYTGLKDASGADIYEGDILKFTLQEIHGGYFVETHHVESVEYSEGAFWVGDYLLCKVMVDDEEAGVVGNIYKDIIS